MIKFIMNGVVDSMEKPRMNADIPKSCGVGCLLPRYSRDGGGGVE